MSATETCSRCDQESGLTRDEAMTHWAHMDHQPTRQIVTAAQVTEEVIDLAETYADPDGPIDWESLWDRIDGSEIGDTYWCIDLGPEYDSPAMRKIQREVRKRLKEG